MSEERCICCGDVIPEGRQVCARCEYKEKQRLGYKPLPYWKQILYLIRIKFFGR